MRPWLFAISFVTLIACANEGASDSSARRGGSRGVVQAGPQDIAFFRSLVEAGEVPAPSLLDQVGFFAEHALEQPPAACGASVCAHPMLAVAPRFDPGTWTMAFVSLNSAVDPATRPREPVHVVLAVESSTQTRGTVTGQALDALVAGLSPDDRVSLVTFGNSATLWLGGVAPADAPSLGTLISSGSPGNVDLYAGIAGAADALHALPDFVGDRHVVLVTSGAATGGIGDPARIEELASALIREGTSFSVVGVGGADYRPELPERIAELGAGTYSFAEDAEDLGNVLAQEAGLRLLPLATEVELRITPREGYSVGRLYGVKRAAVEDGVAVLRVPALFLGARSGPQDTSMGRRGGGGGLFVELVTDPGGPALPAGERAFDFSMSYVDAVAGGDVLFDDGVMNELRPGQRPSENWPSFSAPDYGKAFMMLNMYLALRAMLDLYAGGDCGAAQGVGYMMEPTILEWQRRFDDPDIDADSTLLYLLRENIRPACKSLPVPPSNYPAGCFGT
jgi:Ca-activated chloride channel family protein